MTWTHLLLLDTHLIMRSSDPRVLEDVQARNALGSPIESIFDAVPWNHYCPSTYVPHELVDEIRDELDLISSHLVPTRLMEPSIEHIKRESVRRLW